MARIVPIEIKSNDLLNLKSIDEKINKAIRGLRKETEELYGELANDFNDLLNKKNEEVTENLYDALTSLNEDLQKQIDGEVTAWFLQGPPCDEYGTIYTNKEPVCDWSEVKEEGKDTYKQHDGDTYTDISTFVDNETTPTAGQSWRFCFCERVIDENNTKVEDWHWHKIADSDAVKALHEAGLAQMTADGKATIFISKDEDGNRVPNNYQIGDMWVINDISLQYGNFDRTSGITKGDLLIANATSVDYVSSHWGKELKYTDDTIANEALVAANSAITAANEAHVSALQALNELAEVHADGKVFKNEMKDLELRKMDVIEERNELVGEDGNGGEAGKWEISVDYADEYYVASNNAISSLTYYSSVENCDANCDYITIDKSGSAPWSSITIYYSERQKLSSQIADVTRAYSETVKTKAEQAAESATSAKTMAEEASIEAKVAKGELDEIDNNSVISRIEFATLETQLENIEDDLIEIKNSIDTYEGSDVYNELLNEFNNNYKPSYNNAINALKYHCGKPVGEPSQTATINENKSIDIKSTLSSDDVDYDNDVIFNGVNVDYNNIFLYYEKRQTILNLIAQKVKAYAESLQMKLTPENIDTLLSSVKIGGVNIIKNSRTRKFTQWGSTTALTWDTVENVYCSTIINENSKISFCNVLYAPKATTPVFDITDMQWGGEYISASVDLSIQEGCIATHHDSNPNKAQLELYFRNSADTTIFSAVTTAQTIVYGNNNKDKWNRLSATWKMDKDVTDVFNENDLVSKVYFIINGYDVFKSGTEFKIRNVQFEFATTPSAWSPAPEDIESGIEGVYSIAEDAQKNANAALDEAEKSMNQLNAMSNDGILSVQEKIDVRREWSEIQYDYNQCFANSEQIWENNGFKKPTEWTNYHDAYSALSDYISKKLDLTGTTNTIISGHTGTVNGKTYKGKNYFNAIFADYYTQHNNFMNAVAEQLAYLEVLSLEVGGTNLLKDSDFKTDSLTGFWIYNSNESVPDKAYTLSYDTTNKCLKVVTTKAYTSLNNDGCRLTLSADLRAVSTWSGIKSGENYMLSFDVWADKATEMRCYIGYGTSTTKQIGTEKTRFVAPIKHSYTGSTYYQNIFILVKDICTFYIDNIKLEKGNMASDWSPAPEDTLEQIKEIRTYTDNLTKTLGDSLQKQIDGVVNSYFMEGEPTTSNKPASDWNENGDNGKESYAHHEGDTYTNTEDAILLDSSIWEQGGYAGSSGNKYESTTNIRTKDFIKNKGGILFVPSRYQIGIIYYNSNNVWQKVSWVTVNTQLETTYPKFKLTLSSSSSSTTPILPSLANELKLCINPTAGQSWRWCRGNASGETIGWHWHKIADSDAVRALQAAVAAQDTADGKRRVFTNQPYGPYDVGDLWVKTDANNSNLTDTLYCMTSASNGFNSAHWKSSTVALNALEGLDNLDISTRNLAIFSTASGTNVTKINPYTFKQISADTAALCNFKIHTYNNNTKQESLYLAESTSIGIHKFTKTLTLTCNRINIGDNGSSKDTVAYFYLPETLYSGDTISITYEVTNVTNGSFAFKNVMIVKGNKAVAFQPSPEDIEASIVVGGRNILRNTRSNSFSVASNDFSFKTYEPTVSLKPNTEYVFSVDSTTRHSGTTTGFTVCIYDSTIKNGRNTSVIIPISNERKFVKFKTSSSVTSTDLVLIYGGIAGSTSGNSITLQKYKLEEGNVPTEWSAAPEDIDYLQDIMNHGSTEVNGGLVMTNVLALKDTNDKVTGGISGVENDNVLLWGGGTYYDAKNAASTDYLKEDGNKITTLLRSNGTGKIGVFKISDTQAVVDVPGQGKVVIDASDGSGGIRVLNSSGKINSAILPSSIESYKPKQTTSNKTSGSKTHSGIISENNNVKGSSVTLTLGSVTTYPPSTSEEKTVTYTKRMTNTLTCTSILVQDTINISGSVTRVYGGSSQTRFDESKVTVRCSLRVNGTEVIGCSATQTFTAGTSSTGSSNNSVTFSKKIRPTGATKPSLNCGTNTVTMVVTVTLASSAYAGKLDTINLKVTGGRTMIGYTCTTRTEYLYQPMTIIGNDGLVSLVNKDKYFMVDNSGSTQKIYAKGLSTTKGTAGSGELYISDNLLTAFDQLITTLKNIVNGVRSIGNNEDNATKWGNELDRVNQLIKESGIIANS